MAGAVGISVVPWRSGGMLEGRGPRGAGDPRLRPSLDSPPLPLLF